MWYKYIWNGARTCRPNDVNIEFISIKMIHRKNWLNGKAYTMPFLRSEKTLVFFIEIFGEFLKKFQTIDFGLELVHKILHRISILQNLQKIRNCPRRFLPLCILFGHNLLLFECIQLCISVINLLTLKYRVETVC